MRHPCDIPFRPLLAQLLCAAALAACNTPPHADIPISEAAAARPLPELNATAQFTRALEQSGPATVELEADRDRLSARAEALRARAAGLDAPVLTPEDRARLTEARDATTAR